MAERLRVITWLWEQPGGRVSYKPWAVRIWAAMIRRHLTVPHALAVVTDIDADYGPDVDVIKPPTEFDDARIPTWGKDRPQCLRRLTIFQRDAADWLQCDRVVQMDLDVVVCGSLDPVVDVPDDFRITKGTAKSRTYNGSMQLLRLGARPQVYDQFTLDKAIKAGRAHIGSDQSWLAHSLPGEKTWGPQDGVQFWGQHHPGPDTRAIFFAGPQKPWSLGRESFIAKHYRGDRGGRCLVLGYGATLWTDVASALDGARFEAVIAAPEAAAYWPGPVLAVADNDAHAERLAAMHGFSDVVFCGRSGGVEDGPAR